MRSYLLALLILVSPLVCGCGGGGTSTGQSAASSMLSSGVLESGGAGLGRIEIAIAWPESPSSGKLIPPQTATVEITITGDGMSAPISQRISRTQALSSVPVAFNQVPTGNKEVLVKALDASNNVIAHRKLVALVQVGQTTQVGAVLGVSILDGAFVPSYFLLNKGEVLLLVNSGAWDHIVVKSSDNTPISPNLSPGQSYSFVADAPGTYNLRCGYHPGETGTLRVQFPAPTFSTLSPTGGPSGTNATISGTNFGARKTDGSSVKIGGIPIPAVSWSDTQVVGAIPSGIGATNGAVEVTIDGIVAGSLRYVITPSELRTDTYNSVSNNTDQAYGIALDASGNIYVAGQEFVSGESSNIWVRKYSPSGATLWTRTYNSPANGTDQGRGIAVDSSGNAYVVGFETRTDLGQSTNIWVRKYDTAGATLWTYTYNSPANGADNGYGIALDPAGYVYVTGSETRLDLGQGKNVWVRKYDFDGNVLGTQTYNSPASGDDEGKSVTVDPFGNVYVCGYETRTDLAQGANLLVRKYDPNGNVLGTQTYNSPANSDEMANSIVSDSGGVYVTGYEFRGDLGEGQNILVAKYDLNGNFLGTITYNSPANQNDQGNGIAVDSAKNVYVTGFERRLDIGQEFNIWVRKYDPNGAVLWSQTYNSPANNWDMGQAIAVDSQGKVLVAGMELRSDLGQGYNIWIRVFGQ